jgi:tRNA A-37 threonylcarbamoyl transferase component Bud32
MGEMIKNYENLRRENQAQETEANKEYLESFMLTALLGSRTINSGNNGLIKKIKTADLPPELRAYLEKIAPDNMENKDNFVFKMIKIYSQGKGKNEFIAQKEAYDLLRRQANSQPAIYAKIPKPYLYHEITLNEELKNILEVDGLIFFENKVEVILMDFVDGDDLATTLFKEVLKRHDKSRHIRPEEIDCMNIENLQAEVWRVLDLKLPGGKSSDKQIRAFEQRKVFNENGDKIINFLKKSGFRLDESALVKVENTINLLHQNGMFHRDLHERNIILNERDVFVIDFGAAKKISSKNEDPYEDELGGKKLVSDTMLTKRYKDLSGGNDKNREGSIELIAELASLRKRLKINEIFKNYKNLNEDNLDDVSSQIAAKFALNPSDIFWTIKLAVMDEFLASSRTIEKKEIVRVMIKKYQKQIFFRNRLDIYFESI